MTKSTDNRFYRRFATNLKGTFVLKGSVKSEECTIVDISRKGLCIKFHNHMRIPIGSTIFVEAYPPREMLPINFKGTVKWIKQEEGKLIGGIEFSIALEEDVIGKLI